MGVHGLWKLIETSGKAIPLEALENRVLAVDVSIWLYQLVKGFQEAGGHSVANAYLLGLFHRICKLLFYRIKPVFVFDGGVPVLKRRTIAERQSSRNKANHLVDKLRQTLLENLAKQEALGQALGETVILPKLFQPRQDSLFQLPPLPVAEEVDSDESSGESESGTKRYRYKDIHSIDINSEEFLSLPPDMRHDILTELKETRKQNSWGKLHLIPKERNEFSNYQMQRLLKRRAVQVGIEQAESEMGTRGFTISDLQTILSDQGVDLAQRIAADSRTKVLYSDKSKGSVNENIKTTSSINRCKSPYRPTKRAKVIIDDSFEEIEDDPEIVCSPDSNSEEKECISQKEILQLIKQENQGPSIQKASDPSPRVLGELRNSETGKEEALTVNYEAVENKAGNNVLKLEHGSLPRERSPCQQSSLCPEPLSQASTELTNAAFPRVTDPGSETVIKNSSRGENISNQAPETPSKDILKYSVKLNNSEQKKKRLEVLNYLNKVKEEITSPLKMPTLPDIKIKQEYMTEESLKSTRIPCRSIAQNSSETSEESENEVEFIEVKKNEEKVTEVSNGQSNINSSESHSEDDFIEVKSISDEIELAKVPNDEFKKVSEESESEDEFIEVKSESEEIEMPNVSNDETKKDSEESDSEDKFLEVRSEGEEMEVEASCNGIKIALSSSADVPKDSTLSKPLEILITSVDKLEDDLFADVFQDSSAHKKDSTKEDEGLEKVSGMSFSSESLTSKEIIQQDISINQELLEVIEKPKHFNLSTRPSGVKESLPSDNDGIPLLYDDMDTHAEKETPRGPSPVPQLSTEEIMKMKRDLERESSDLMVEAQREERIASTITEQIRLDAQELLQLFGIPYIIAPMEAEAQCAHLDLTGQTQGTITDDSDIWLFGGRNVYKNFFDQKKFVMQFKSTDIAKVLHMERDEMIMLALLTGSDYTLGLTGVGAVTALEVVAHYPKNDAEPSPFERLHHFAVELQQNKLNPNMAKKLKKACVTEGFPSVEVINAYLDPEVDASKEKFTWSKPNLTELRRYTQDKFGWDKSRTDKILEPVFENLSRTQTQGTLHSFFDWKFDATSTQRSKRIENAINLMKTSTLLAEPGPSRARPPIIGNPLILPEEGTEAPIKSKTPAQIAREKAAKKFNELKKQGKIGTKKRKN